MTQPTSIHRDHLQNITFAASMVIATIVTFAYTVYMWHQATMFADYAAIVMFAAIPAAAIAVGAVRELRTTARELREARREQHLLYLQASTR